MFDAQWREHGHIDRAVELLRGWAGERPIEGLSIEVVRLEGRTPVIFMEAPGTGADTVLLYGHLDKQPEMVGWAEGTGPWTPVQRGDKLYGRGVGDDGYATFAALTAIQALQEQRTKHARCVVLIEACEESGARSPTTSTRQDQARHAEPRRVSTRAAATTSSSGHDVAPRRGRRGPTAEVLI
jgi:acetylornithine deacetylase/succinyl-diaminopimelate desuccinylase-like protein